MIKKLRNTWEIREAEERQIGLRLEQANQAYIRFSLPIFEHPCSPGCSRHIKTGKERNF